MAEPIHVKPGEAFEIVLEGTPTTGYKWELAQNAPGGDVVELIAQILEPDTAAVGGAAVQRFSFRANKAGSTRLQFAYRRAWEAEPRARREYNVVVHPGGVAD